MPIRNRFSEIVNDVTAWRRDIHANPELLFDTHRTSALVAEKLTEFGCDEVITGIGRTGVVGVIKGKSEKSGRVIGLRADMDALPMTEVAEHEYSSRTPGMMHACGHDGHTAMLLGASRYLAETRNFDGTAIVIFQPAEEGGGGGLEMCQDGMMERFGIQEVYGMHNWPGLETGQFAIRSGPFFAAADQFEIKVIGKGGHAAKPDETVDPTVVAAQIVLALQTIVSRNSDPVEHIVISVTSFETASHAYNIIPPNVTMKGTMRTMTKATRQMGEQRMRTLIEGVANAFGATAEFNFMPGYPSMVNHDTETQHAIDAAQKVTGQCDKAPLVMGGEDFAYMLEERPGAYILIGNGDTASVHHPEYDFNDEAIPAGCSWWVEVIEGRMPTND